jgi:hypothetical protein
MSACLLIAGKPVMLAAAAFTLSWTHSVEKTEWRESWRIANDELLLVEARVRGSGAGMEPGKNASLIDGWWVWRPENAPVRELVLAASGVTGNGWRLCGDGNDCVELGNRAGEPIPIRPCSR